MGLLGVCVLVPYCGLGRFRDAVCDFPLFYLCYIPRLQYSQSQIGQIEKQLLFVFQGSFTAMCPSGLALTGHNLDSKKTLCVPTTRCVNESSPGSDVSI